MFGSLKLGRLLGIDLYVHGTFWLLPALVLFGGLSTGGGGVAFDLAFLFAAFGCVALHELGHAAAAAVYGIRTRDITLYPIGGVARLEAMPDRPWPEIAVALAGPAVNVAIAAALAVLLLGGGFLAVSGSTVMIADTVAAEFLIRLLMTNLFLVGFNLIPAFPMDGGRVLRAGLHLFTDRATATRAATTVGGVLAGLMVVYGLVNPGSFMLVFIGAMVFLMGRAELDHVRQQAEWGSRPDDVWGNRAYSRRPQVIAEPLNGWEWDAETRTWIEYRDGFPIRRWPAG